MSAPALRRVFAAAPDEKQPIVLNSKHVRHAGKVLQRLVKRRDALEAKRAAQLWTIAKAIDTLAREELKVVSSDKKADDVEVEFVGENATVAAAADTVDVEWPSSDDDEA